MRNELIPKVLKEYRKRNHYSVKDVSIRLMEHDIDVAPKTIYGWESGQAQPTADTLLLLCEIYKIPDINFTFLQKKSGREVKLSKDERVMLEHYSAQA